MQTSGTFPQLSEGRSKGKKRGKAKCEEPTSDAGWTKRQPRPIDAPKTLAGRRNASHKKAYK